MDSCPLNRKFLSPAQHTRYAAAVKTRYSCRAFCASPDVGQLAALNYAAQRLCLPGVRIEIADCPDTLFFGLPFVGRIHGTGKCAYVVASKAQDLSLLLAGISGEAFVLEATAMGVNSCWVSGSYRRSAVDIALAPQERIAAVIPLGLAEKAPCAPSKRKNLSQICLSTPSEWPAWAYRAAEAVRWAPSAVNLQPWKLNYGQHCLRLLGRPANRIDFGIAMLHIEATMDRAHRWEWGEEKCVARLIVEDDT